MLGKLFRPQPGNFHRATSWEQHFRQINFNCQAREAVWAKVMGAWPVMAYNNNWIHRPDRPGWQRAGRRCIGNWIEARSRNIILAGVTWPNGNHNENATQRLPAACQIVLASLRLWPQSEMLFGWPHHPKSLRRQQCFWYAPAMECIIKANVFHDWSRNQG